MARPRPAFHPRLLSVIVFAVFTGSLFAAGAPATAHADGVPLSGTHAEAAPGWTPPMAQSLDVPARLGPLPSNANDDVSFEVVDMESDYGQEVYKNDYVLNARSPDALENQTTNWDNALGHHIRFTVEVDDGRADLECDDRFVAVAVIETTHGPLYGWTNGTFRSEAPGGLEDVCVDGLPGVRVYEMVFDLDGSPATITGTPFPALLPGFYTARLELYHHEPSPTDPGGMGPLAGVSMTGFALQDPRLSLDPPLSRFPESMLRMIGDVGSHATHTHQFAMPIRPLQGDDAWNLTMDLTGISQGTAFTRVDHFATRTVPGVQLPADPESTIGETPLDPVLDKIQDQVEREALGVEIHRADYDVGTVPASRLMSMEIRNGDFPSRTELLDEYVPLHVVTILVPATMETFATGAQSLVVPVSERDYPLRSLTLEEALPMVTSTQVLFQDSEKVTGGPVAADAGDLFALRNTGAGHESITRTVLEREPDSQWVTGDLAHLDFEQDTPRYRIVAMLYGPLDEFMGMRVLERGIDMETSGVRFVEGTSGTLTLQVSHLRADIDDAGAGEGIEARIVITGEELPGGGTYNRNVTLGHGETTFVDVPLQGTAPGVFRPKFTATSGELTKSTEALVEVISIEQAREENRRWYEIPPVTPVFTVLALLAVLAVVGRRRLV